jgi:hypothetical protein
MIREKICCIVVTTNAKRRAGVDVLPSADITIASDGLTDANIVVVAADATNGVVTPAQKTRMIKRV